MTSRASLLLLLGLAAAVAGERVVCPSYVVAEGDTISVIAEKLGMPQTGPLEEAIAKCDPTYTPGGTLVLGQRICLPPTYEACKYVKPQPGAQEHCKYYVVQPNDTLEAIALALGLNRLDLEKVNPNGAALIPNTFVKMAGWNDDCPAEAGDSVSCRLYVAEGGDSLANIAMAFSVSLEDLRNVNAELAAADQNAIIQPGMGVRVPPFTEGCGAGVPVSKPIMGNCNQYLAVEGDTLFGIATTFQTNVELLQADNPALAAGGTLAPGSWVIIPPYGGLDECVAGMNEVKPGSFRTTEVAAPAEQAPEEVAAAPAPAPAARRMLA